MVQSVRNIHFTLILELSLELFTFPEINLGLIIHLSY